MKNNKFIIAGLLAFALTACTSNSETSEETTSPTESITTTAEESTVTEDKPVTADSEETTEAESEDTTAAEEDVPAAVEDTMTAELIEELSETYTSVIADEVYNRHFWRNLYGNLIDITGDDIPELVLTYDDGGVYYWAVYGINGEAMSSLWGLDKVSFNDNFQDSNLFYDYPQVSFRNCLSLYQNGTANSLFYTLSGSGRDNRFTYIAGFVGDDKFIIVEAAMTDDDTKQGITMSVYKNEEVLDTAEATRNLLDTDDGHDFADWDDLTAVNELYDKYFGERGSAADNNAAVTDVKSTYDFANINPLVLDSGENELFNDMMAQMFYWDEYGDKYAEYALPKDTIHTILTTALENYNK